MWDGRSQLSLALRRLVSDEVAFAIRVVLYLGPDQMQCN